MAGTSECTTARMPTSSSLVANFPSTSMPSRKSVTDGGGGGGGGDDSDSSQQQFLQQQQQQSKQKHHYQQRNHHRPAWWRAGHPNGVLIWAAIFLLTVPLALYGYLSCQLLRTTQHQQLQLELLHRRVDNLTALVDGVVVVVDSPTLSPPASVDHHPRRVKRHSVKHHNQHSHHHHHHHQQKQQQQQQQQHEPVQLGKEFRWIPDSTTTANWTEKEEAKTVDKTNSRKHHRPQRQHRRRQVEMIPDTDVHFFSTPRPSAAANSAHRSGSPASPGDGAGNYEWLSSYSRVSVSSASGGGGGHMHAYYLPFYSLPTFCAPFFTTDAHPFSTTIRLYTRKKVVVISVGSFSTSSTAS